jgi:3-oxo-5-alpha-steroid 4-dehydrogenase 1
MLFALSHASWVDAFAASGALTLPLLFVVPAPYGKEFNPSWGRAVDGRWAWALQEAVSPLQLLLSFQRHGGAWVGGQPAARLLLALWCAHYVNRALLYPLLRSMSPTTLPVVAAAVVFNLVNGWLVGAELAALSSAASGPPAARLAGGLVLFALGEWLNVDSDARLRALRKRGDRGHHVPHGGLFALVCCPHYLGELVAWTGFALASGLRSAAAFAFWTFANLAPRAWTTRKWYRLKFGASFPHHRRCLIPFIY